VSVDAEGVRYTAFRGQEVCLRWGELDEVTVETTNQGPFAEDLFAVLRTAAQTVRIPQEAVGFEKLLSYLKELPDFDAEAVIKAAGSTDNATFACWKRGA
jgi:hypothetical protein